MPQILDVNEIDKFYADFHVVKNVSFSLEEGEIGCLLGPSGCGKTTLLRTIAGFEDIATGTISIDGNIVAGKSFIPPEKRNIGMVFQDYALFPHLTVRDNVAFGLHEISRSEKERRTTELLETVGLGEQPDKYPHELSGGQQQRVALARALAPEPRLLLMDEPFSNLDVALREALSREIRDILKERFITAVMVTHNQHEAFAMADKIGVISDGVMQQWDNPHALYIRPANQVVAGFVGEGMFIRGKMIGARVVACALGTFRAGPYDEFPTGTEVRVLIRPEHIDRDDEGHSSAIIVSKSFRGSNTMYVLSLDSGEEVQALMPSNHQESVEQRIGICHSEDELVVFPSDEACHTILNGGKTDNEA